MSPVSPRSSGSSDSSDGRHSPINGFDSSAALILVPDTEDNSNTAFGFSSDDEDTDDEHDPQRERLKSSPIPPLSSTNVFLYLLLPFLKLGALLVPDTGLPLKIGIPALFVLAGLSALTRHLWYMLARYVRKADLEEIVLETFARGRGKERRRALIRHVVRFSGGALRILLAALYLRASTDMLLPLLPEKLLLPSRVAITLLLALGIAPLVFASSLGVPRVVYATWISVASYAAWLVCTAVAQAHGTLEVNAAWNSLGTLWQGMSVLVFAFSTSSTVPLYASLKGSVQPISPKPKRSQSFKIFSALCVGLAALAMLPLTFFRSSPAPSERSSTMFRSFVAILTTLTLILTIPSVLITCPALPVPLILRRSSIKFPLSKFLLSIIVTCLSLLPQSIFVTLSDATLVLAFISTYMLPAFLHIVVHLFKRPLTIVIPPSTPITPSPDRPREPNELRTDELLQRKERTLQRRRLGRRIVWDIAAWLLLVPVGGGGLAWAGGRIIGGW